MGPCFCVVKCPNFEAHPTISNLQRVLESDVQNPPEEDMYHRLEPLKGRCNTHTHREKSGVAHTCSVIFGLPVASLLFVQPAPGTAHASTSLPGDCCCCKGRPFSLAVSEFSLNSLVNHW